MVTDGSRAHHPPTLLWDTRADGAPPCSPSPGHKHNQAERFGRAVAGSARRCSVRLYPALEGTSTSDGAATLCASQHAHATGLALALDDGQALVLD
jgi:hypothetical protein